VWQKAIFLKQEVKESKKYKWTHFKIKQSVDVEVMTRNVTSFPIFPAVYRFFRRSSRRTLINEKFPAPIFLRRIDQRSSRTPLCAQRSRNIITRNTISARENYGGIFPWCTSTKLVWASAASLYVRPRCCLSVNPYIRVSVYRCVHDIRGCIHAITFETLREGIADTICALRRDTKTQKEQKWFASACFWR